MRGATVVVGATCCDSDCAVGVAAATATVARGAGAFGVATGLAASAVGLGLASAGFWPSSTRWMASSIRAPAGFPAEPTRVTVCAG